MARVILDQVSKTYPGGVQAVHPVDLNIEHGEFAVLVGPSGCGKSTTLRMIAGLEEATSGTITIGDRVVNDVEPRDRDIAMVFQSYALYPHMSVHDNLAFGLKMRKMPRAEIADRVRQAADFLGISELLERKPRALSGGQRQRVALGRALVRDPAAFLFDEPLSNLDAKMRVQMRTEIARIHHRLGATMIYVTHDQTEAMTLGQRIVVMKDGVVQQVAPPLELYERPVNKFVAGFIGSPAMNFLTGKLVRQDGLVFVLASGGEPLPLPEGFSPPAAALDQELVLGVRPEHIGLAGDFSRAFPAQVQVVEALGNETLLYFTVGEAPVIVRTDGSQLPAIDDELQLTLQPDRIQLFAQSGDGLAIR
ncbi:hypothetical protein CO151_07185 [bacterium CG_4_9_14_3_um_filter_65_15]|nr:MAG: hypothetical protein CO151_07185 [bacterium CG_4_9_14_3_um_filter_65_15]